MYSGIRSARKLYEKKDFKFKSEILQFAIANQQAFCDQLTLPVTRIGDAIHILKVLIGDQNT
jgi:hypothetical protein